MYFITIDGGGKKVSLRYSDKQEALDEWDKQLDNVLDGETATLSFRTETENRTMSTYEPFFKTRKRASYE